MKNKCKYFDLCGGCSQLEIPYDEQLTEKRYQVGDALDEFNIDAHVEKTVGMYYPFKYRNKIHLAIRDNRGQTSVGFFEEHSNRIVDVDKCLLHDSWVDFLITTTKQYIKKFNISGFNKKTNRGTLKYIVARCLDRELLVTIVATTQNFSGREWFYNELTKFFKGVSLYINVNTRSDNAVFEDKMFFHKHGFKKLRATMLDVKFELSPNSFFQVNTNITEKIYRKIFELLEINNNSTILDLYSGIGITSLIFAKAGAKVVSIESIPDAVNDAKNLIKINKCESLITPLLGKCETVIQNLSIKKLYKPNGVISVFLDPPRIGAQVSVLEAIKNLQPHKIVYLSCNPKSLARDLKVLTNFGFSIDTIIPFDMFPQTNHVETLVCLSNTGKFTGLEDLDNFEKNAE